MDFLKPTSTVLKRFYDEPGKNLKLILSHELDRMAVDSNRRDVTRTVYGVIRNQRLLDFAIQRFSKRSLSRIQSSVLPLLRIGAYLLLFSESYPDYAALNEVVGAVGANAKGFVNAILRNIATNKSSLSNDMKMIDDFPTAYSISSVLIDHLKLISSSLKDDLEYLNREPSFHLRVNTKDSSYEEVKRLLTDHGIAFKELETFRSFEIKETGRVLRELFEQKLFYFQDAGSQVISIIASRFAKIGVLDCCSAPGSKSVTLSLLNPALKIYANDINPLRMRLIKEFVSGNRFPSIHLLVSDARRLAIKPGSGAAVDFVIVDAPCTSSGTLRKNPDLKLKIDESVIARNSQIQYDMMVSILNLSADYFLYSVCSFTRDETEGVMERVMDFAGSAGRSEIETVDLASLLDDFGFRFKKGKYGFYLLPDDVLNNDIFYVALFYKSK